MDQMTLEQFRKRIDSKYAEFLQRSSERVERNRKIAPTPIPHLQMTKTGPDDYAITGRDVESNLHGGLSGQDGGVIFAGCLTKGIVMTLPEHAFILSNCCNNDGTPILVRVVGEQAKRAELWNQVRALRMNGRRFYVFAHEAGLNAHLARLDEMRARYDDQHRR